MSTYHPIVTGNINPQLNFFITTEDGLEIATSYSTVIGYRVPGEAWTVRENEWGNTTARHMLYLDDAYTAKQKGYRLDGEMFERHLQVARDERRAR